MSVYRRISAAELVWVCLSAGIPLLSAQPVIRDLAASNVSHASALISWSSDVPGNRQVAFDTQARWNASHAYRFRTPMLGDYQLQQSINMTGLQPATAYVACPSVCDASGHCRTCGDLDPRVTFTTAPEPSPHPSIPALPNVSGFDTSYPGVDAHVDVAPDCSDLQTQINAAAGARYAGLNVEVRIPAGAVCTPSPSQVNYALPTKSGGGWVILRSSQLDSLPAGTRVSPGKRANMATVRARDANGAFGFGATDHYRLAGLYITHVPLASSANSINHATQPYLVRMSSLQHDVIFDRCVLDGGGFPERVVYALYWHGADFALLDSYLKDISVWRPYQDTIAVTRPDSATNVYSGGTAYFGNSSAVVHPFSVHLTGTGTGKFRLFVQRDGSVRFVHNVAGLATQCAGCSESYDPQLTVPVDAFNLMDMYDSSHDDPMIGWAVITNGSFTNGSGGATGSPLQIGSADGSFEGSLGLYIDDFSQNVIVRDTYFGVTGIDFFVEQFANQASSDIEIERNTFQSDPLLFVPQPGAALRAGLRRSHIELKQGVRVLIDGNQFLDAWVAIGGNDASAIQVANRLNGNPLSDTHDITIQNNSIELHPSCFWVRGTDDNTPQSRLTRNVRIENNFCEADAYSRSIFTLDPSARRAYGVNAEMGGEDLTIVSNTFLLMRGSLDTLLRLTDQFYEGVSILDNVFVLQNDNQSGGVQYWGDNGYTGAVPAPTFGAVGSAALNQSVVRMGDVQPGTPNWLFSGNVIVAGCVDSSLCEDSTSGSGLLDPATFVPLYPSTNRWPDGRTYGARVAEAERLRAGAKHVPLRPTSPLVPRGSIPPPQ